MNLTKDEIRRLATEAGAAAIGFARAEAIDAAHAAHIADWVGQRRHGQMAFMQRYLDLRCDPRLLLEGARTVISVAVGYDTGARHRRIASYALTPDYHYALRQLLQPVVDALEGAGYATRVCVDSVPVAERYWAQQAGVGAICHNRQLAVPGWGQRVFLAEILTDADFEPDSPLGADLCGDCRQCLRACPGGALGADADFDARRCASYLTIEHRGPLPEGTRLAGRIFGCDACLDACPLNRDVPRSPLPVNEAVATLTDADIATLTSGQYRRLARTSPLGRTPLAQLRRNLPGDARNI